MQRLLGKRYSSHRYVCLHRMSRERERAENSITDAGNGYRQRKRLRKSRVTMQRLIWTGWSS